MRGRSLGSVPFRALAPARARAHTKGRMHGAEGILEALARGDLATIAARLADGVVVDDPREGRVAGREAAERWLEAEHAWLAALSARAAPPRATVAARAAVVEALLTVDRGGDPTEVPAAIAAEEDASGKLVSLRLYHSFWPIERAHRPRGRVLPPRPDVALSPPVDAYQRALAAGDVDGVLACYEAGAGVREPAGGPWTHRGLRGLRRFYGTVLWDGGVVLEPAGVVDDGVACALEYTVVQWGRKPIAPQGGLAVYERGESGRLAATRIYDDVDPPWR